MPSFPSETRAGAESQGERTLEAELYEAALSYLARFSTSRAQLGRVLARRLARGGRGREGREERDPSSPAAAGSSPHVVIERILDRLTAAGLLDDAAYAAARRRHLLARGASPPRIAADLARRGISREIITRLLPRDGETEMQAALAHLARRKLGLFAPEGGAPSLETALKALARAGFSAQTARAVLRRSRDEAQAKLAETRRTL